MILIEFVFDASSETRNEVADLTRRTAAATLHENGCVLYRFTTDIELPNRFILIELWENEDALKAHFAGDAFRRFWAEVPPGGSVVSSTAWQGPLAPYNPPDAGIQPPMTTPPGPGPT